MLSEEEKKAIKYFYNLRATIDESNMLFDEDLNVKCGNETIIQITAILNLIEKQQKEIDKLKEDRRLASEEIAEHIKEEDYIPKDKVLKKLDYLDEEGYFEFNTDRDLTICCEILRELLQDNK